VKGGGGPRKALEQILLVIVSRLQTSSSTTGLIEHSAKQ
jgi:hypothetical protein